jgi:mRNA-degrading endonuclease RelE of RelBE toxin-antitoxin system
VSRRIAWSGPAARELRRLDRTAAERVRNAVVRYAETDHGAVIRLQGADPPAWRLRVGDYRVLFHFEDTAAEDKDRRQWMMVEQVLHRREAYR